MSGESFFDPLDFSDELETLTPRILDRRAVSEWPSADYDRAIVQSVWRFADTVAGNDPDLWRKDEFGAWINRLNYGKRQSEFGWEICDVSLGRGNMGLMALRPMQWQNYLDQVAAMTQSRITADGLRNTRKLL